MGPVRTNLGDSSQTAKGAHLQSCVVRSLLLICLKGGKKQNRDKGEKSGEGTKEENHSQVKNFGRSPRLYQHSSQPISPEPLSTRKQRLLSSDLNRRLSLESRCNCACGKGANKVLASRLPGSGSSCQRGDRHTKSRAALRVRACLLVLWVEAFGESLGASSRGSPCEQCSHI